MSDKLPDGFSVIEKKGELVIAKKTAWDHRVLTSNDLVMLTYGWDIVNVYKWVDSRMHVVLREKEWK